MKKKFKKIIGATLIATSLVSIVGCSRSQATEKTSQGISRIIAFGDSYSDNGSAYEVSTNVIKEGNEESAFVKPGELYWENRYSNGKTAIEIAAELADLQLVNYATGGATSGYENYTGWMDSLGNTGVLGQIDKFTDSLKGEKADKENLYFILAGTNDYCKFIDFNLEGTVEGVADQVVKNFETAVRKLAEVGAEKFLLSYAHDVSTMPYEIVEGRQESAKVFASRVNEQLPEMVEKLSAELSIEIATYDITKTTDKIIANPEQYGFTQLVEVIQPTWPEVLPVVEENVETYMFFDEWHPSMAMHKILGESIYEVIKAIQ